MTAEGFIRETIQVSLSGRSYEVTVGSGILGDLAGMVSRLVPMISRAVVITQGAIPVEVDPGVPSQVLLVPDGESAKSVSVAESLCRKMATMGITRSDLVVALGGFRHSTCKHVGHSIHRSLGRGATDDRILLIRPAAGQRCQQRLSRLIPRLG